MASKLQEVLIVSHGFPRWFSGEESACNAEDAGDVYSNPGSGRSPQWSHGNPFQHSYLENPHRGTWRAMDHRFTKSWAQLKQLSKQASIVSCGFVLYDLGFPGRASDKEPICQCRLDNRVVASIPRLGRSSGGGHWQSTPVSCLENPMDRGAWKATAHRVTKSWTGLK